MRSRSLSGIPGPRSQIRRSTPASSLATDAPISVPGAVPAGVLEEVAQEMPEQPVVSHDADRVSGRISGRISGRRSGDDSIDPRDHGIDPRAFLGGEGQEIHRPRRLQVLHRLQPAREQQLVDEGVQLGDVPLDALAKLRARRVGEELDRHANPGEGAAQLV